MTVLKGSSSLAFPTLKTQEDAIEADLAPDSPANGDHAARGHLSCPAGVVVLQKAGLCHFDPTIVSYSALFQDTPICSIVSKKEVGFSTSFESIFE